MIDLRWCDPTDALMFVPDDEPVRLCPAQRGTAQWESAEFEIRQVSASGIPGVAVGDFVLFSRVAKFSDD